MKTRSIAVVAMILAAIAFTSCKQVKQMGEGGFVGERSLAKRAMPVAAAPMAMEMAAVPEGAGEASPPPPAQANVLSERKLMKSAALEIEVKDLENAREKTKVIVDRAGGFIANSSSYEDNAGQKALNISLRVPAQKLDETISDIKAIGRVKEERVGAEDVTEQYIDLEARLANAKKLEQRLLALLESKASRLKDLLDTERELARVRTDIDTMEGRKRFMDNRINLSTINLTFTEPRGFGRGIFAPLAGSFQRALSAFTGSLATLIIVVSALTPWIVLVIIVLWIIIKIRRARRQKKKEINLASDNEKTDR